MAKAVLIFVFSVVIAITVHATRPFLTLCTEKFHVGCEKVDSPGHLHCVNLPDNMNNKASSVNTHGHAAYLYAGPNCKGSGVM
uniref:Transmembrane protein n=1 Tax=Panagrellus redivivus TaxID=6233 RepID=A0A7E4WA09_PANRE